jgi:hypothetical protein
LRHSIGANLAGYSWAAWTMHTPAHLDLCVELPMSIRLREDVRPLLVPDWSSRRLHQRSPGICEWRCRVVAVPLLQGGFIVIRMLRGFAPVFALVAVLSLAATACALDTKGKIKTVSADKNEFVMNDADGKAWTFAAAPACKVTVNDKESKLADLQADDEVQVTYEKVGDKLSASAIKATRK